MVLGAFGMIEPCGFQGYFSLVGRIIRSASEESCLPCESSDKRVLVVSDMGVLQVMIDAIGAR